MPAIATFTGSGHPLLFFFLAGALLFCGDLLIAGFRFDRDTPQKYNKYPRVYNKTPLHLLLGGFNLNLITIRDFGDRALLNKYNHVTVMLQIKV